MKDASPYFKIVSLLMQYPDKEYLRMLPELEATVKQLTPGRRRAAIEAFLADTRSRSALDLQERYTAAFDLNPATTLNMTYHLWGDGEKRAGLLTHLQQAYASAGYEKITAELPDFLPLVLEFMAAIPEARRHGAVRQCLAKLATVVDRLREIAPPYAELLHPLASIFENPTEARVAAGTD